MSKTPVQFVLPRFVTHFAPVLRKSILDAKIFLKSESVDQEVFEKIYAIGERNLQSSPEGSCPTVLMSSDRPLTGKWADSRRVLRHEIFDRLERVEKDLLVSSPYFIMTDKTDEIFRSILKKNMILIYGN